MPTTPAAAHALSPSSHNQKPVVNCAVPVRAMVTPAPSQSPCSAASPPQPPRPIESFGQEAKAATTSTSPYPCSPAWRLPPSPPLARPLHPPPAPRLSREWCGSRAARTSQISPEKEAEDFGKELGPLRPRYQEFVPVRQTNWEMRGAPPALGISFLHDVMGSLLIDISNGFRISRTLLALNRVAALHRELGQVEPCIAFCFAAF